MKMPHTEGGYRMGVMPRQRACSTVVTSLSPPIVNATMKIASDTSIRMIPQVAPGVPGRMVCGGYNVHPAPVGPPGTKKLASEHQHREQIDPEREHVHVREHHVPRAAASAESGGSRIPPGTAR